MNYIEIILFLLVLIWGVIGPFYFVMTVGEPQWKHYSNKKVLIFMLLCGPIITFAHPICCLFDLIEPVAISLHRKIEGWINL
jgi:hypothetical protein